MPSPESATPRPWPTYRIWPAPPQGTSGPTWRSDSLRPHGLSHTPPSPMISRQSSRQSRLSPRGSNRVSQSPLERGGPCVSSRQSSRSDWPSPERPRPAQVMYSVHDLGSLYPGGTSRTAGINALGQTTGRSVRSFRQPIPGVPRDFRRPVTDPGANLGTISGSGIRSEGDAINDSGQVVGTSEDQRASFRCGCFPHDCHWPDRRQLGYTRNLRLQRGLSHQ